jgi:hypothetical protein
VRDKMSFRFGIAIPETGNVAFVEAGRFQACSKQKFRISHKHVVHLPMWRPVT